MKHGGFTVIELLVVVAVIGILAAFLFPVFARAKDHSQAALCIANLGQIGRAVHLYGADFDDAVVLGPSAHASCSRLRRFVTTAEERLVSYGASAGIYRCPKEHFVGIIDGSFEILPNVRGFDLCGSSYWLWAADPMTARTLSSNVDSSRKLLANDSSDFHGNRANFLFMDGHVAAHPFEDRTQFLP
jgi:prepilin-type N-terminal cleavage/methylation domain-containing protein/prepilin-type processing-associated H-X9-DG protein